MLQSSARLGVATRDPGLFEFSRDLNCFVAGDGVREGLLTVFCRDNSSPLHLIGEA